MRLTIRLESLRTHGLAQPALFSRGRPDGALRARRAHARSRDGPAHPRGTPHASVAAPRPGYPESFSRVRVHGVALLPLSGFLRVLAAVSYLLAGASRYASGSLAQSAAARRAGRGRSRRGSLAPSRACQSRSGLTSVRGQDSRPALASARARRVNQRVYFIVANESIDEVEPCPFDILNSHHRGLDAGWTRAGDGINDLITAGAGIFERRPPARGIARGRAAPATRLPAYCVRGMGEGALGGG